MHGCSVSILLGFWRCIWVPRVKACYLGRSNFEAPATDSDLEIWIQQLGFSGSVCLKMQKREILLGSEDFVRSKQNWCCCEMFHSEKTKREEGIEVRVRVSYRCKKVLREWVAIWSYGVADQGLHGRFTVFNGT